MSYSTVNNFVSYLIRKSCKLDYVFQMKIISSGLIKFRSNYAATGLERGLFFHKHSGSEHGGLVFDLQHRRYKLQSLLNA